MDNIYKLSYKELVEFYHGMELPATRKRQTMLKNLEEYYNNKEIEGEIINNNANMEENENHRHKSDNHTNDYVQQDARRDYNKDNNEDGARYVYSREGRNQTSLFTFKDVEESLEYFDGTNNISIIKWV